MVFKNNQGVNQWKVGMFYTPCENPLGCLFNCFCAPCASYRQREKLLGDAPYVCCMGSFGCCCLGQPCEKVPWLCVEVCCCLICSVTANRSYIQRTKGIMNDACDDCIIITLCACQLAICIAELVGVPVGNDIQNAVDCFYHIVIACMLTQQDIEINPDIPGPKAQVMA